MVRWLAVLVIGCLTWAASAMPAHVALGFRFADTYSAYAPLFALYRSYADHLFEGTDVSVPPEIGDACQSFAQELGALYIDLVVQTPPATAETMMRLVHLRGDLAGFCADYGETLEAIAATDPVDLDLLRQASRDRLFATIRALNERLEAVFATAVEGIGEGIERWWFAVAFSMRSILRRGDPERIDSNIAEILYGEADGAGPPIEVPPRVSDAMAGLIDRSGRTLLPDEVEAVVEWASVIADFISNAETGERDGAP